MSRDSIKVELTPADMVTELQMASFKRHQRNGTSPGMPKWYRSAAIRPFVPVLSVKLPAWVHQPAAEWLAKQRHEKESLPDPFHAACGHGTTEGYVLAFEQASHLKPVVAEVVPAPLTERQKSRQRKRAVKAWADQHLIVVRVGDREAA